jgi:hypothetical protein
MEPRRFVRAAAKSTLGIGVIVLAIATGAGARLMGLHL